MYVVWNQNFCIINSIIVSFCNSNKLRLVLAYNVFECRNYFVAYSYVLLNTIVLNSRDWQGFLRLNKQLYNNVSFKCWLFIYWYEINTSAINPFEQPKHALKVKKLDFNILLTAKVFPACLPACPLARLPAHMKLLKIISIYKVNLNPWITYDKNRYGLQLFAN